MEFSVILVC